MQHGVGHPLDDRVPRHRGPIRRVDDPDGANRGSRAFQGQKKRRHGRQPSSAAITGLAPTLGPLLSGWIEYNWSWRGLFFVNVVLGGVLAVFAPILVRIDEPDLALLKRADYPGIVLMATAFCLNYVLQEGYRWDWFSDPKISICAVISAVFGNRLSSCGL